MTSEWRTIRAADFIDFNPRLSLKKGDIATKVAMDKLKPFTKKIPETEKAEFNGGAKFCNGDTVMARITPCLENGKTAYAPELDNNWDAISAVAEWAGVVVGAIIVPLVVVCLQHKWESNKEEIALSNLVTIDQLREFEQKIAPLLKEQESDKAPLTIKPELSMREQQLLQFLSVSMGASRNEISEQLGLSGASTQHLIKRLLEEEKIEACGAPRSRIYKVSRKQ